MALTKIPITEMSDIVDSELTMNLCHSVGGLCELEGTFFCNGCRMIGVSKRLCAKYCGPDCQKVSFEHHKAFHKAFKLKKSEGSGGFFGLTELTGYEQTCCLTLLELRAMNRLFTLRDDVLSVIFAGAREEQHMDFNVLFQLMKEFLFPTLQKLKVALIGPDVDSNGRNASADVEIIKIQGKLENHFRTNVGVDVVFVIAPGFSDNLDSWEPAFRLLLDANVPVVCTGYSSLEKMDNDALFDENVVVNYYRGQRVVPMTQNPQYNLYPYGPLGHKNRFYFICQGIDPDRMIIPKLVFKQRLAADYLRFQADYYGAAHPAFARGCLKIARELDSGKREYKNEKHKYFIALAREMS